MIALAKGWPVLSGLFALLSKLNVPLKAEARAALRVVYST